MKNLLHSNSARLPEEIVKFFWQAPDCALFDQKTLSIVLGFSLKWFERKRWEGEGIPFIKIGGKRGNVRYKKSDVLAFLEKQKIRQSTSDTENNN